MQPRLSEKPGEWRKFAGVMACLGALLGWWLYRRELVSGTTLVYALSLITGAMLISFVRPRWFRGLYRAGMTLSFHVGQWIGRLLLTLVFFLVLTPLGLTLRLFGKDLLKLRKDPAAGTYWTKAKNNVQFDRQF